jgi:hypothetical protein
VQATSSISGGRETEKTEVVRDMTLSISVASFKRATRTFAQLAKHIATPFGFFASRFLIHAAFYERLPLEKKDRDYFLACARH